MRLSFPLAVSPHALLIVAAICLSTVLLSATTPAETPTDTKPVETIQPADAAAQVAADRAQQPPVHPSPMMQAIHEALQSEHAAVAELEAQIEEAFEETQIVQLMREIERIRRETEWSVLRIQAEFAREAGELEKAQRIESLLDRMEKVHEERQEVAP